MLKFDLSKVNPSRVVSVVLKFVVVSILSSMYCAVVTGLFEVNSISVKQGYCLGIAIALVVSFLYKPLRNTIVGEGFIKGIKNILKTLLIHLVILYMCFVTGLIIFTNSTIIQIAIVVTSILLTYLFMKYVDVKIIK